MGIASVTVYCNESFRIAKWIEYYNLYKDELELHIIVDNNSTIEEFKILKEKFPNSIIIRLETNGGVTAAYNAGIKYVMDNNKIDTIAFIGNDIKIETGGLTALYNFLMADDELGEVSPVLLKKDSLVIEDNGDWFDKHLIMREYDFGKVYSSSIESHISDGLPGAINLAKKTMYQSIGLLNETIFMYSDEVDIGIRAKRAGFKFSSCSLVKAWHQHEIKNNNKNRHPFSNYLVCRNKVYLAGYYFNILKKIEVFCYFIIVSILSFGVAVLKNNKEKRVRAKWQIIGSIKGLVNDMNHNKYSSPNGV